MLVNMRRKGKNMVNVIMFLYGFSSVVSVYEIAKTDKKTKTDSINRKIEKAKKYFK